MYSVTHANSFKKDSKLCQKRNYDLHLLKDAITELLSNGKLQAKYKPHKLSGNYHNRWECHIKPDWLLIWKQDDDKKEITLEHTGSHSDLF